MNRTEIEWVKNPDRTQGYTWNPITGCLNHVGGLCKGGGFPCYAYKLANGRLKERYRENENVAGCEIMTYPRHIECIANPFYPRFWEERLNEPYTYGRNFAESGRAHKGIFVCDMGELFGDWVPREWQEKIFYVIKGCSQHRFYLLTKQPQNLIKWNPFPENVYIGVTATDTYMAVKGLQCLDKTEAKVKFISFEPLLEQTCITASSLSGIGWVIIGQQTPVSAKTEPKIEWIQEIVAAADKAEIPVFLKDNLKPLLSDYPEFWEDIPQGDHPNYESIAELRQEMPEIK